MNRQVEYRIDEFIKWIRNNEPITLQDRAVYYSAARDYSHKMLEEILRKMEAHQYYDDYLNQKSSKSTIKTL